MQFGFYAVLFVIFAIASIGWWSGSSPMFGMEGGRLIAISRLLGIIAALCILLQLIVMSRAPWIEKYFDLEEIQALHRLNGYGILGGIVGHTVFVTLGYAAPGHTALWEQFLTFNTSYEDVLKATIGTIIFIVASLLSVQLLRTKMHYELWRLTHLTLYGAVILSFLHQVNIGGDMVAQTWFQLFWYALFLGTGLIVGYYRFLQQVVWYMRHQFTVDRVIREAEGIYSIYIRGRHIESFVYKSGQYAGWRFLTSTLWWEVHPYSLSSSPGDPYIRLTVKANGGDFSKQLARLTPGTKALIDGPRGSFTSDRARTDTVVCIGGGIGIAPLVPIAKELIQNGKHVMMLYGVRTKAETAFGHELSELQTAGLTGALYESASGRRITKEVLHDHAFEDTTYFICGPDSLITSVTRHLEQLGIAKRLIISERFNV